MFRAPAFLYRRTLVSVAASLLLLAACSSGGEEAISEVATLESDGAGVGDAADAATLSDAGGAEELLPDEAALEFSQCMRGQGLDFPDLAVDAEGNIELRAAFQTVDRRAEGFQEAFEACGEILQQTGFGGGRRQALESPEVQDALLEFSECVREAGYDVGDLTLGRPGPAGDGQGEPVGGTGDQADQRRTGQREQGFGSSGARYALQLGLDYEDPAVQAAIDGCVGIVDEAFAAAGIGG